MDMTNSTSLVALPATELRRLIGTKDISPVELLEACIAQIERIDPAVNALAARAFGRARSEAKAAEAAVLHGRSGDPLGRLHGLPIGIKDLQDTQDLLTTHGSAMYNANVPANDAAGVALVRAAGAIVVAKTNVPEFGAGANTRNVVWGATGNPFDPTKIAGGSSGGSAVALATDMLPLCNGSDTGGSLRTPASLCGVVGFRPSPGLVPMDGRQLGWTPISVQGPMGRNVGDLRMLFASQIGLDARDPLSHVLDPEMAARTRLADLGTLRVAWTTDFGQCPVSAEIRAVMRRRMSAMRHLFRAADEVDFDMGEADRCFDVIRALNFVARHRDTFERHPEKLGPNIIANMKIAAAMSLDDAAWAHVEQTRIFRRFQQVFRDYDLVLAPTVPVTPFPWTQLTLAELEGSPLKNYYHWLALMYVITLATNPAITLPCGVDDHQMPFGLQVVGRFAGDVELLDAAAALEHAFERIPGLGRPRPDLSKLATPRPELKSIVTDPPVHT